MFIKRNSETRGDVGRRFSLSKKVKLSALMALTAFCCVLTLSVVIGGSLVCYAVSYDGTQVGRVADREVLREAIEAAEAQAAQILGQEYPIAPEVTVTADLGVSENSQELAEGLLSNVEGIIETYAITVDGEPVGAMGSQEDLQGILDSILGEYSTSDTLSVGFAQDVKVEYMFVSDELPSDARQISRLLDPEGDGEFSLTVISSGTVQVLEQVPFETVTEYNDEKYSDEQTVFVEGVNGLQRNTYVAFMENGQEISRQVLESQVISEPVTQVMEVGSIPGSRTDSTGSYIWPTDGHLTSDFGSRSVAVGSSNHKGLDIAGPVGTPVWAADGGTVTYAQYWSGSGYGNIVMIEHDNGDITYYAHLNSISVSVGDKVAQGDIIGEMGATGNVSGSHLHFEVRPGGGEPANPLNYLP